MTGLRPIGPEFGEIVEGLAKTVGAHTPGPLGWTGTPANASGGFHAYLTDPHGRKIAALWGAGQEKIANAHLFSTAPDLLEAVKRARRHAMNIGVDDGSYVAQLDAAIARAEGRAP